MTDFLILAFVFLTAGIIAVPLASRFGLGSVLGYLIAGIAISPLLSVLHVDVVAIQHFAEFGVVMMLFLIGLELEPKLLWEMRSRLIGLGGGQLILTTGLIFAIALLALPSWQMALAVGLILAGSSTAISLQTLNENGLMKSDGGKAVFSVLLTQDIAVIPILALLPLLASPELADTLHIASSHADETDGHTSSFSLVAHLNGWQTALVSIGAIAAVILCGNHLTRPLFRFIASANLRELFTAAALLIVIAIAVLMLAVGLSPALGTFLAGVVLANSEYRHELESDIEPFKGLLLGLFFITVGAAIDFKLLQSGWPLILSMTFGLIALKAMILYSLGALFKVNGAGRWLFALILAQTGEFGFVLLSFSVASHTLPTAIADQLSLVVALSMLATPLLFIIYDKMIAPRFGQGQDREADKIDQRNHIIIAGHGRMGGIVDRMVRSAGFQTTVLDYSSKQLDIIKTFGIKAYYGDATRPDMLHAAGIEEAKILVVAIDDREQISALVEYAIHHYPDLHVIARAADRHHVYELWALGCHDIIREVYDSSLRIGRSVFEALGVDRDKSNILVDEFNQYDQNMMIAVANAYRKDIPAHENADYVKTVLEARAPREAELMARMKRIMESE